jgi:hypothetical protein
LPSNPEASGVFVVNLAFVSWRKASLMSSTPSFLAPSTVESQSQNEVIRANGFECATRRGQQVIASGFQIHHFEIMAGWMLDQHRLRNPGNRLRPAAVGVVHPPDHLTDAATEMGADQL